MPLISNRGTWCQYNVHAIIYSDRKSAQEIEEEKTKMSYTVKAIIIQVYDKGHTFSQDSNFESNVQEAKNWDITIVRSESLKYSITVIISNI